MILEYESPLAREKNNIFNDDGICNFSGFGEEERLVKVERRMKWMSCLIEDLVEKQSQLKLSHEELKKRYEASESELEYLKKENDVLRKKCSEYEVTVREINKKMELRNESAGTVCKEKLEEMRNDWKKEDEVEKVNFREAL